MQVKIGERNIISHAAGLLYPSHSNRKSEIERSLIDQATTTCLRQPGLADDHK
jgi:hypothetical protein